MSICTPLNSYIALDASMLTSICKNNCPCKSNDNELLLYHIYLSSQYELELAEHLLDQLMRRCTTKNANNFGNIENADVLVRAYALIGYTRDILHGRGLRQMTYMHIWVWFAYFPILSKQAIHSLVALRNVEQTQTSWERPYGSWRDIKEMAHYVYRRTHQQNHVLIEYCVDMFVQEIYRIYQMIYEKDSVVSKDANADIHDMHAFLCIKWCPRERGKHKWLFRKIAITYMNYVNKTLPNTLKYRSFRKIIHQLSSHVQIIEQNLSLHMSENIDFSKVSVTSFVKYFWALKHTPHDVTRSNKMSYYSTLNMANTHTSRFSRGKLIQRVHELSRLNVKPYSDTRNILQTFWNSYSGLPTLVNTLPIIDVSRDIENKNAIYDAIATGIYLSEHTLGNFKDRVAIYSDQFILLNLGACKDIYEKVNLILQQYRGNVLQFKKIAQHINDVFVDMKQSNITDIPDLHKMTFIFISNHFHDNHVDILKSTLCILPKIVFYLVGGNYSKINCNEKGFSFWTETNLNTFCRNISRKRHTKTNNSTSNITTSTMINKTLHSKRYKLLIQDIMLHFLTIDDLKV